MKQPDRRKVLAVTVVAWALVVAVGFALSRRADKAESWKPAVEGFLAVATPCCTEASLWDSLDEVTADGQRARPASAAEAAQWLNDWPYRDRDERDTPDEGELSVAAQSSEVRCVGAPTGPEVPREGDDEETLKAIRYRRECTYAKWKVWAAQTAEEKRLNERHTVWADEAGFFHGRVDYWK
jgi:hypothetical protein